MCWTKHLGAIAGTVRVGVTDKTSHVVDILVVEQKRALASSPHRGQAHQPQHSKLSFIAHLQHMSVL